MNVVDDPAGTVAEAGFTAMLIDRGPGNPPSLLRQPTSPSENKRTARGIWLRILSAIAARIRMPAHSPTHFNEGRNLGPVSSTSCKASMERLGYESEMTTPRNCGLVVAHSCNLAESTRSSPMTCGGASPRCQDGITSPKKLIKSLINQFGFFLEAPQSDDPLRSLRTIERAQERNSAGIPVFSKNHKSPTSSHLISNLFRFRL